MSTFFKKHKTESVSAIILVAVVIITILYGAFLSQQGIELRQWHWQNLLVVIPFVPLLFLQETATLPPAACCFEKQRWVKPLLAGIIFGLLDVLVVKIIMHPQAYESLPPFLQRFPYSIFLYTSGALEVELYHRLLPITLVLLADRFLFRLKHRNAILIVVGILSSFAEPIMQFPEGAWWFIVYATASGIAMNGLQFWFYIQKGFMSSLTVRLGHYLVWHILLGIYVQFVELP